MGVCCEACCVEQVTLEGAKMWHQLSIVTMLPIVTNG